VTIGSVIDVVTGAQRDVHGIDPTDLDAGERNALVAQQRAVVALHRAEQLLDRAGDIHLVEEMDAATQVETEAHGLQAQCPHPNRRARLLRERDQVLAWCGVLDRVASCELLLDTPETQDESVALDVGRFGRQPLPCQDGRDAGLALLGEGGTVVARQLQRRGLAEHVRQREQGRHQHDDGDQPDFPGRIGMHAGTPLGLRRS